MGVDLRALPGAGGAGSDYLFGDGADYSDWHEYDNLSDLIIYDSADSVSGEPGLWLTMQFWMFYIENGMYAGSNYVFR